MKKNETVFDRCVAAYFRYYQQYQESHPVSVRLIK
jgi:hypothetical protein